MARKYFGTDGIRGCVGEFPITADFVMKLGWAAGKVLGAGLDKPVFLIGKDTRVSGYMFESALQAGLIAAGCQVGLLGPMPTPAIAYLTRTFRAQAGIVISASHNPYQDNGIKFFSADGYKLPDDIEAQIETYLDMPFETSCSQTLGKAFRVNDAGGRYIEYCKSTVDRGFSLQGMTIVVDCAHGATYQVAPEVFQELGARVIAIGASPNGTNINRDVGATKPASLQEKVIEMNADLGIALDGDGDRLIMVDHRGAIVDGDEILWVIAQYRASIGDLKPVVGTLMSNLGLENAIKKLGVEFFRAQVGDRYVIEKMRAQQSTLGGESSGHIIVSDMSTTGDGIVAALQVLQALMASSLSLSDACAAMNKYPQTLLNVPVAKQLRHISDPVITQAVHQAEKVMGNKGRVLLRPSGTEALVRVMVEGDDPVMVEEQVNAVAEVVKQQLGVAN